MKNWFILLLGFCLGTISMYYVISQESDYHIELNNTIELRDENFKLVKKTISLDSIGYYIEQNEI